jgi:hypothetical protein
MLPSEYKNGISSQSLVLIRRGFVSLRCHTRPQTQRNSGTCKSSGKLGYGGFGRRPFRRRDEEGGGAFESLIQREREQLIAVVAKTY